MSKNSTQPLTPFRQLVCKALGAWYANDTTIEVRWTTGGMTGGNCWGGKANCSISSDPEPEFEDLDRILEQACPQIGFIQYKRIVQDIVKYDRKTSYEYYGNYYNYSIKTVNLEKLEQYLIKANLWTPPEEQS